MLCGRDVIVLHVEQLGEAAILLLQRQVVRSQKDFQENALAKNVHVQREEFDVYTLCTVVVKDDQHYRCIWEYVFPQ